MSSLTVAIVRRHIVLPQPEAAPASLDPHVAGRPVFLETTLLESGGGRRRAAGASDGQPGRRGTHSAVKGASGSREGDLGPSAGAD